MTYKDESKYEGNWHKDTRQGEGIEISKDGSFKDGVWENDHFLNPANFNEPKKNNEERVNSKFQSEGLCR